MDQIPRNPADSRRMLASERGLPLVDASELWRFEGCRSSAKGRFGQLCTVLSKSRHDRKSWWEVLSI